MQILSTTLKASFRVVCFAAFLLIAIACGVVEKEVSPKDEAISLLNARKFDEAISVLLDIHAKDKEDDEIKLLLASAYTGSTGLNVIDAYDVFKPLIFKSDRAESDLNDRKYSLSLINDNNQGEEEAKLKIRKAFIKFLDSLSTGFAVIFSMPYSESSQRRKLVQAILYLEEVKPSSDFYFKAQNYLVLLNLTQFLNYTKDAFPDFDFNKGSRFSDLVCNFQPVVFAQNSQSSLPYLANGIKAYETVKAEVQKPISPELLSLRNSAIELNSYIAQKQASFLVVQTIYSQLKKNYCF